MSVVDSQELDSRINAAVEASQRRLFMQADARLSILIVLQWIFGILLSLFDVPSWTRSSGLGLHFYAALFLAG